MFKISFFTIALVYLFIGNNLNYKVNCQSSNTKLNIEVYYETLCPDSKRFINNQVSKIYQNNLLQNITNVILVPYGKASVNHLINLFCSLNISILLIDTILKYTWNDGTKYWDFKCQHGENECLGNRIHVQ
jgi:hypothetical protein